MRADSELGVWSLDLASGELRCSPEMRELLGVEVVEPRLLDGGVGFGCAVVVRDEDGATHRFTIVGPDELDARAGRVSAVSPIGAALLGHKAGDVVEVERAGRTDELEIVRVVLPQ